MPSCLCRLSSSCFHSCWIANQTAVLQLLIATRGQEVAPEWTSLASVGHSHSGRRRPAVSFVSLCFSWIFSSHTSWHRYQQGIPGKSPLAATDFLRGKPAEQHRLRGTDNLLRVLPYSPGFMVQQAMSEGRPQDHCLDLVSVL